MAVNLLISVWSQVIAHFGSYDQPHLHRILVEADKSNKILKGFIVQCFRLVDVTTSVFKKDVLVAFVERMAYVNNDVRFFNVNEGEDFCFTVTLEAGKDFTGYWLTIRNAEDQVLLSPDNIAGNTDPVQNVNANDLALAAGDFYKIHVLLEHGSTAANGDAAVLLADAILIVGQDLDI